MILLCVIVLSVIALSGFKVANHESRKGVACVYDAQIDGTDYWFNFADVHYDGDGDINETPISGYDAGKAEFISIEICPGKGANCQVVVISNHNTYVFVGKKTPGGPDISIS